MDKVRVLIVGRSNSGKTTIAHIIRLALEEAGFEKVFLFDQPESENKQPIEKRIAATKQRLVHVETITLRRITLGDAPIVAKTASGEFEIIERKKP